MRRSQQDLLMPSPCGLRWQYYHKATVIELCEIDAPADRVAALLGDHAGRVSELVLLTPSSWWQAFHLTYPKLSKSKATNALMFEAEPLSPLPLNAIEFADPTRRIPGQVSVLSAIVRSNVEPLLLELRHHEIQPSHVAPLSVSIAFACMSRSNEAGVFSCRVATRTGIDVLDFENGALSSWKVEPGEDAETYSDLYRVQFNSDASEPQSQSPRSSSIGHDHFLSVIESVPFSLQAAKFDRNRMDGHVLQRWGGVAAMVGMLLLVVSLGLHRRASVLGAAVAEENKLQQTEYVSLYPNASVPIVISDRLVSNLNAIKRTSHGESGMPTSRLDQLRETLVRFPAGSAAEITRLRFDHNGAVITGLAPSLEVAETLGRSVSQSASTQTSNVGDGRIEFEIRIAGGDLP